MEIILIKSGIDMNISNAKKKKGLSINLNVSQNNSNITIINQTMKVNMIP